MTGVNPTTGTATTDAQGIATFSYAGANEGTDTVVATATINATQATSNDSHITWLPGPILPVPEVQTLVLFGIGALALIGMVLLAKKRVTAG